MFDDDGRCQSVDSGMVNDYLREAIGGNGEGLPHQGATVRAIAFLSCVSGPSSA